MTDYQNIGAKLQVLEAMGKKVWNMLFRVSIARQLNDSGYDEPNISVLTVHEVIDKIREFVNSNPSDESYEVFLRYLACYPVSMCKRQVTPLLKFLVGMHYRLGVPNKEQKQRGIKAVTYDELAQVFGRSKATISECIHETEVYWKEYQNEIKKEEEAKKGENTRREKARMIALDQLVEEEKEKLRLQQNIEVSH